jgi:hypothetical protein
MLRDYHRVDHKSWVSHGGYKLINVIFVETPDGVTTCASSKKRPGQTTRQEIERANKRTLSLGRMRQNKAKGEKKRRVDE